ncbi:MAG: transcription termination factor NusA [Candidatus Gracilibacteria bacterium]|jgi:N utilization substance protein A|nr:transcription termination factor NusA [Candidatus Gracilibacteria bacterium]
MQTQFLAAINQLCDEKNIPKDAVMETVKAALRAAYRKDYGNKDQNVDVDIDDKSGLATVYLIKEIVKAVEDDNLQIDLKEAKKYDKNAKVGDTVKIDVTPSDYGRIAAQSAKQVIIQRLQEAERDMMYDAFKDRENELLNAVVHRVDGNNVYLNLDNKTTMLLPYREQIPKERYYSGQRLKLYLDKVIKTNRGPELLISRTHPFLVKKLLELEIPEIKAGLVKIEGIAREPGIRTKVAVSSSDPKIDPIGSCVGQKGVRVQNVMDELNGERIDVILFNSDAMKFIETALSPAKVSHIDLNEKEKRAKVFVQPDQRPLAIGKQGQNVRLASILTGWEIDVLDISEYKESGKPSKKKEDGPKSISELEISDEIKTKLENANLSLVEQLKGLSVKDLSEIEEITEEEASEIIESISK